MEEEFVSTVSFPKAATVTATNLGYQVLSLVSDQVRKVIDSALVNNKSSEAQDTNHGTPTNNKDCRRSRRGANDIIAQDDLPIFTLHDVSFHDTPSDCWMVIYDRVYDVTSFLQEHPGGDEVMLEYAGRDATLAFRSVGHSSAAETNLKPYLIGILTEKERIWTRFFNMSADFPV